MNSQEAVNLVNIQLKKCNSPFLSEIEHQLFIDSWNGISYEKTAFKVNYSSHYLRYLASQMWKRLSSVFEVPLSKRTLHNTLQECRLAGYSPLILCKQSAPLPLYYQPYPQQVNLSQAIIKNYYQVIGVFGMVGVGKSTFAQGLTQQVSRDFDRVIWHSFQAEKLSFGEWFNKIIFFLTGEVRTSASMTIEAKINELMAIFRQKRILVIFDHLEQLFCSQLPAGQYDHKYQDYRDFIQHFVLEKHQSYLIFTSRDYPEDYETKLKKQPLFYPVLLRGLQGKQTQNILSKLGINAQQNELEAFHLEYDGNPWALTEAALYFKAHYPHQNLACFWQAKNDIFKRIAKTFDEELKRLSALEKTVVLSLANESHPFPRQYFSDLNTGLSKYQLAEALASLSARSLLKMDSGFVILSPLFQAYLKRFCRHKTGKIKELAYSL